MAIDNLQNSNDQNPLSGPYIRSIVKQPNLNTTHKNLFLNNNDTLILPNYPNIPMTSTSKTNTTTTTRKQAMARPSNQRDHAQGHKKQVRRRLHTSRPYQERLLNMAEARKEIVTALKYHRASMKQANDRKQAQQNDRQQVELQQVLGRDYYESSRKVKSEHLSVDNYGNCYPSDFNNNNNNNNNNNHNYNQNYCSASNTSTSPSNEPTSILYESLHNIPLPNQTLGLNLNLQSFTNLDTKLCHRINTTSTITTTTTNTNNYPSSITTSPSSSSSSLSNSSGVTATTTGAEGVGPTSGNNMNSGMDMHPTLDQEEIAKMRSIGEQYQIEWDDTLNLVKSARWFKFLKTADYGKEMKESYYNNGYDNLPFGELMEIPPWLSPINDDESFLQQHLDDSCSDDTTLPWMDIGDIDAMDDEWLSKDSAV